MLNEYLSKYAPSDGSILIEKGSAYRVCKGFERGINKYLEFKGMHYVPCAHV